MSQVSSKPIRKRRAILGMALLIGVGLAYVKTRIVGPLPIRPGTPLDSPAPMAKWPWPHATQSVISNGVTHWQDRSSPDGTVLHLYDFDFATNPHLRFEIYDQDEDDSTPGDNRVDYWPQGVAQVTRHLNTIGRGPVIAAWNGLFFSVDHHDNPPNGIAQHVGPVVLNGKTLYNVGNHRWTFGVKYGAGLPRFQTLHLPDKATIGREFSYASVGAQCLVREGRPLRLQPYPKADDPPVHQPVPSTPQEVGYIPVVDHIRTSRASLGWSRDGRHLYLLFVKEPDSETASIYALRARQPLLGGWMVSDEQHFWLSFGAWGAINSDGGDVAQLTVKRRDGRYQLYPDRWATATQEQVCSDQFENAPQGGSLMYFIVRDAPQ